MKRVAIITARGGSKRLPRKNIRPFHGRPIIHYAIDAARECALFDEVMVSTDDEEIATVAMLGGCARVIKRPAELASDIATTGEAMAHAVSHLLDKGEKLEHVACIYPCTPLMLAADLQRGFDALVKAKAPYAYAVCRYSPAPQRMLEMDEAGMVSSVWEMYDSVRTQDLEAFWYGAGQWYWGTAKAWRYQVPIHGSAVGVPIERWRAIDIDDLEDWELAEAVYQDKFRRPKL